MYYFFSYLCILIFSASSQACKVESKTKVEPVVSVPVAAKNEDQIDYDTSKWTELIEGDGYYIDIKYATTDNFVKEVIYPCGRCFLRNNVALALADVRDELKEKGFRLKLFDCYRPRSAQYKLWEKVPDRNYVAPPGEGSMHNRGSAVDLTITDRFGREVDMGTPYDFFGPEAHHDYTSLPKEVLSMRHKLKSIMETHGFVHIRTEWWHYSFGKGTYPLEDWQWPCD